MEHLIYDRSAIFSGEIWRLVTGHGVHYSASHLAFNLTALAIIGAIVELQERNRLFLVCAVSALIIGVALLVFRPDLDYFAGASGVVTAVATFCAVRGLATTGPWRTMCLVALLLLVGKITLEFFWHGSSLVGVSGDFVVVPLSHAIGAASGLLMALWWNWRESSS
jgi:rhomboid family GlyGly-CTERM serine protease